jgi:hypothetical protein
LDGAPLGNRIQEGIRLTVLENVPKALENSHDGAARGHLQGALIVALYGIAQPDSGDCRRC